jgi:hypothetical protein
MGRRRGRSPRKYAPLDHFDFLMSVVYDRMTLHPDHLADLKKSALTAETISVQKIRTVPPHMIRFLLGRSPYKGITSAYVIPFYDPRGHGWMPHIRMKVFPTIVRKKSSIKYLQPRNSTCRIFFPISTVDAVLHSTEDLYCTEGEKKALAVSQSGVPTIGIAGVEGWHLAGSDKLHPDLDDVGLDGRTVHLWPDSDIISNEMVRYAMDRLGLALKARGVKALTIVRSDEVHS